MSPDTDNTRADGRADGRADNEGRPIRIQTGINAWAEGSCIVEVGATRVHCTASVTEELPAWRRASGKGWVTAEYRMLPRATHTRTNREDKGKGGRTAEIERLIGRSLRAAIDLRALGPRQIQIDCDVLQADGGTRCASIVGGWVALALAIKKLLAEGLIAASPLRHVVAALSVGIVDGRVVLDLPYAEDARAQVDLNLIMTQGGLLVEVQGCAEGDPFPPEDLSRMLDMGRRGIPRLCAAQLAAVGWEALP